MEVYNYLHNIDWFQISAFQIQSSKGSLLSDGDVYLILCIDPRDIFLKLIISYIISLKTK